MQGKKVACDRQTQICSSCQKQKSRQGPSRGGGDCMAAEEGWSWENQVRKKRVFQLKGKRIGDVCDSGGFRGTVTRVKKRKKEKKKASKTGHFFG